MLPVLKFWLKRFIDWLREEGCEGNSLTGFWLGPHEV